MVNIVMAVVIGALLVFGSGLFAYVPSTVLDGIVLGIGIHLLKIGELKAIFRSRKDEFVAAMLALVVVAFVGVEQGVLVYRFDSPLFFANATHFDERIRAAVEAATPAPTTLVIDAAAMTDIDVTGTNVITRLAQDLEPKGISVVITELSDSAAQIVHDSGLDQVVRVVPRVEDALAR
jgi:MFS superfamily sulfate permease-like transporter